MESEWDRRPRVSTRPSGVRLNTNLDPTLSLNLGLAKPQMQTEPQSQMMTDSIWGPNQD